jgi:N-acetylglucosamine kinase-like BadF-type ATPase
MTKYFLGVDGGGTKTEVICVDQQGQMVGQGSAGPTNLTSTNVGSASMNLLEAIRQATELITNHGQNPENLVIGKLVMGLAGIDTQLEKEQAQKVFVQALSHLKIGEFVLVNDSIIALRNAVESQDAVVLISGTGTVCYGTNSLGQEARASGLDFLLSDQGSGYYIGRQVLREAVKSYDGRSPKSVLEEMVCQYFRIESIDELKHKVYNPLLSKNEVADLAKLCTTAFGLGDQRAKWIFEHAVDELVLQVETVVRRLGLVENKFELVFAGSILKIEFVRSGVLDKLRSKFGGLELKAPEREPVWGAVKMAMV